MAKPVVIELEPWKWVKVVSNAQTGILNRLNSSVTYYQTYRDVDDVPPPNPSNGQIPKEAVRIFEESNQELIGDTTSIDVYILCCGQDGNKGELRVDLW